MTENIKERLIKGMLFSCTMITVFTTIGIILILVGGTLRFFTSGETTIADFLFGMEWQPQTGKFGFMPLFQSTVITTLIALVISGTFGLLIAVYLNFYASERTRRFFKPFLEILAGIPTVVYGYFAVNTVTPLLQQLLGTEISFYNRLSAGIVMGIMIIALIASLTYDALRAVSFKLRDASFQVGATKLQTILHTMLPEASPRIAIAFSLAIARASGETMIVALSAGAGPNSSWNPLQFGETVTGYIARISGGDISYGSPEYLSLFPLGLTLLLITMTIYYFGPGVLKRIFAFLHTGANILLSLPQAFDRDTSMALPTVIGDSDTYFKNRRYDQWGGKLFRTSAIIGIIVLLCIIGSIVNNVFGYIAVETTVDPKTLTGGRPVEDLSSQDLFTLLQSNTKPNRLLVLIRDTILGDNVEGFTSRPIKDLFAGKYFPEETVDKTIRDLSSQEVMELFLQNVDRETLIQLLHTEVIGREIVESWTFLDSVQGIPQKQIAKYPQGKLEFASWLNTEFLSRAMSSDPTHSGIRTALKGSIAVTIFAILASLIIGGGAAVYIAEYMPEGGWKDKVLMNIQSLASVPSIVYGLLGLALFVKTLEGLTGGRTIISAALTMMLLSLPLIILSTIGALKSVPMEMRFASYRMGVGQWKTIRNVVLPEAWPGILTGVILTTARAIGETAPLIVVGAATYITTDPTSLQSPFTVLPLQIYTWSSRPESAFHHQAAAASLFLILVVGVLNTLVFIIRERARK